MVQIEYSVRESRTVPSREQGLLFTSRVSLSMSSLFILLSYSSGFLLLLLEEWQCRSEKHIAEGEGPSSFFIS